MTQVRLGGIQLDDADFEWPLYHGASIRPVVIAVDAERTEEFKALPYITTLEIVASAEDGTTNPAEETITIEGVRVIEIREVNDVATEIYLSDVRAELARRVFPSDFLLRWKDGYLAGTNKPTLREAIEYAAGFVPELAAALAPDAFDEIPETDSFDLPEKLVQAGRLVLPAIESIASTVGSTVSVGYDGLIRFPKPAGDADTFATDAYSWVGDIRPSWDVKARNKRGLPQTYRVYYNERHAIRTVIYDPRATSSGNALAYEFEQVYGFNEQFGTLTELLEFYGFSRNAISEEQIADKYMTANFEGTDIQRDGSVEADTVIAIIKRDWHQTYRFLYADALGRRGGWTEKAFGRFIEVEDKDGTTRYAEDPQASPVRAEWTQWLAVAEPNKVYGQEQLLGSVVARSHPKPPEPSTLPTAPFDAEWLSEPDGVFRIKFNGTREDTASAWVGKMAGVEDSVLTVERSTAEDDHGNHVEVEFGLYVPEIADIRFQEDYEMEVFIVATRRLPNNQDRWTHIDVEGFADGDVELAELEVGEELYAIRDYVGESGVGNIDKPQEADGFGRVLNQVELEKDAERRVRILKEDMAARLEGRGVAQGIAPVLDLVYPKGPISEMVISVDDSTVVLTRLYASNRDSAQARYERKLRRERSRKRDAGGVPVV